MMKNRITSLIFKNINIPVVEFTLSNGAKARGMIDTGSESTMVDTKFLKANRHCFTINVTDEKMNFVGFYGSQDRHLIKISGSLTFNKHDVFLKDAIVAPLESVNKNLKEMYGDGMEIAIIFGSDFFADNKVDINYKTNKLVFNDSSGRDTTKPDK